MTGTAALGYAPRTYPTSRYALLQKPDELLPEILLPSPLVHDSEVLTLFRAIRALNIRLAPHASDPLAQCAIVGPGRRSALPFRERGGEIAHVVVRLAQPDPSLPVLRLELHRPTKRLDRFPRVPLPELQARRDPPRRPPLPDRRPARLGIEPPPPQDVRLVSSGAPPPCALWPGFPGSTASRGSRVAARVRSSSAASGFPRRTSATAASFSRYASGCAACAGTTNHPARSTPTRIRRNHTRTHCTTKEPPTRSAGRRSWLSLQGNAWSGKRDSNPRPRAWKARALAS